MRIFRMIYSFTLSIYTPQSAKYERKIRTLYYLPKSQITLLWPLCLQILLLILGEFKRVN